MPPPAPIGQQGDPEQRQAVGDVHCRLVTAREDRHGRGRAERQDPAPATSIANHTHERERRDRQPGTRLEEGRREKQRQSGRGCEDRGARDRSRRPCSQHAAQRIHREAAQQDVSDRRPLHRSRRIRDQEQSPRGVESARLQGGEERLPARLVGVPERQLEPPEPLGLVAVGRQEEAEEVARPEGGEPMRRPVDAQAPHEQHADHEPGHARRLDRRAADLCPIHTRHGAKGVHRSAD